MVQRLQPDLKLCIPKAEPFSQKLWDAHDTETVLPLCEIWDNADALPLPDDAKKNYNIIQFSFVMLNRQGQPLFIERRAHLVTRGVSILHSCSPCTHPRQWTCPDSLDRVRWYFEHEIRCTPPRPDIDLLGIARNIRKETFYYFYIFLARFNCDEPKIRIIKERDNLTGFHGLESVHLLKGNKVDLLVMHALFPRLRLSPNEIEDCVLIRDRKHVLRNRLFQARKVLLDLQEGLVQIDGKEIPIRQATKVWGLLLELHRNKWVVARDHKNAVDVLRRILKRKGYRLSDVIASVGNTYTLASRVDVKTARSQVAVRRTFQRPR